jgi:hypothetical protein
MRQILLPLPALVLGLFLSLPASTYADDILWKLDFKDLAAGKPLTEVPYAMGCSGPQKVTIDADNTLLGVQSLDSLSPALQITKNSTSHYMPAFSLKSTGAIAAGVVTVKFDIAFDKMAPNADHPVETLMTVPFLNAQGGTDFSLLIVAQNANTLVLAGTGLAKAPAPFTFKLGDVAHIKVVLDLDKHTCQAFLNDTAIAEPEHDDQKFGSFLGLTVRDGTALGGNYGGTFTAALANLVVSH